MSTRALPNLTISKYCVCTKHHSVDLWRHTTHPHPTLLLVTVTPGWGTLVEDTSPCLSLAWLCSGDAVTMHRHTASVTVTLLTLLTLLTGGGRSGVECVGTGSLWSHILTCHWTQDHHIQCSVVPSSSTQPSLGWLSPGSTHLPPPGPGSMYQLCTSPGALPPLATLASQEENFRKICFEKKSKRVLMNPIKTTRN